MGHIIGIDLGTTNSLASVWLDGKCVLIPNAFGEFLTPSVVNVDNDGTIYVGKIAKERLILSPENTASVFKRNMGLKTQYKLGKHKFYAEELSALVLGKLKEDAERFLGEEVTEAVISVPAYFNDMGRSATKRAGAIAGLKVERIINEPSAAALACRYLNGDEDATMLIFDFGGGTLDVSLVDCFENVIEILAVSGDNHLGGHDFDCKLADYFMKRMNLSKQDISEAAYELILRQAEVCKKTLSEEKSAHIIVDSTKIKGDVEISRNELVELCDDLFDRMAVPVRRVLQDGNMSADQIDQIVLVGGSCKMEVVKQYLRYLFKGAEISVQDPDHMIALGVGTYVGIKERNEEIKDMLLTDICPFSLGTQVINDGDSMMGRTVMSFIIERNSVLPISKEQIYTNAVDGQTSMELGIYQGESLYPEGNMKLGEIVMPIPPLPQHQAKIFLRFTYDINGILEVVARSAHSSDEKRLVIVNEDLGLSQDEIDKQLKKYEKLKLNPAEEEENKFVIEWGQRLYAQCSGRVKEEIKYRLLYFDAVLKNNPPRIDNTRRHITVFFAYVEQLINQRTGLSDSTYLGGKWYTDEEEEDKYEKWLEDKDDV